MRTAPIGPSSDEEARPPTRRLTDPQAERLWRQLEAERHEGTILDFEGVEETAAHLSAASDEELSSQIDRSGRRTE
jgi:hypothetical protein